MRPPIVSVGDRPARSAGVAFQRLAHLLMGELLAQRIGCFCLGIGDRLIERTSAQRPVFTG